MRRIHYAYSGFKYHKKMGFIAIIIFSVFLFATTCLLSLVRIQEISFAQFKLNWQSLRASILLNGKNVWSILSETSDQLTSRYFLFHLVCSLVFLLILGIFFGACLVLRKKEISSMKQLGISSKQISQQFLLEMFFPLIASLVLVSGIFFLFSTPLSRSLNQVNQKSFAQQIPDNITIAFTSDEDSTNTDSEAINVLPYSTKTFLNYQGSDARYNAFLKLLCINFILLVVGSLISLLFLRLISSTLLK